MTAKIGRRSFVLAALAAAVVGAGVVAQTSPSEAQYYRDRGPGYDPFDNDPYTDGYKKPLLRFHKRYHRRGRWCHYHEYKARGMRYHSRIRCHRHGRAYHPSLEYNY